jgi:predicted outer membrane protein
MKKLMNLTAAIALLVSMSFAQEQKAPWPQMEAFHSVMSTTYHPAEEGKFEPIKTRIGEMVTAAMAWQKSEPPAGYDKPGLKEKLKDLTKGAKELEKLIKKQVPDAELKTKFTALHDLYHEIVGLCADSEEKH